VTDELLQRNSLKDSLDESPYYFGLTFGTALWVAYAWITRLRYGVLPHTTTVHHPCVHSYSQPDAPNNPSLHIAFLFSFVLFVLALICIVFSDPGICVTPTKDALRTVRDLSYP
jgi:hypothetical protein